MIKNIEEKIFGQLYCFCDSPDDEMSDGDRQDALEDKAARDAGNLTDLTDPENFPDTEDQDSSAQYLNNPNIAPGELNREAEITTYLDIMDEVNAEVADKAMRASIPTGIPNSGKFETPSDKKGLASLLDDGDMINTKSLSNPNFDLDNYDYNYPGMNSTMPKPAEIDTTYYTKEYVYPGTPHQRDHGGLPEEEQVEAVKDFRNRDLNKDGKVSDLEETITSMGWPGAIIGELSDLGRKFSVGDKNAGLDYEGEAFGTPDSIFDTEATGGDGGGNRDATDEVIKDPIEEISPTAQPFPIFPLGGQTFPGQAALSPYPQNMTPYTGVGSLSPFQLMPPEEREYFEALYNFNR